MQYRMLTSRPSRVFPPIRLIFFCRNSRCACDFYLGKQEPNVTIPTYAPPVLPLQFKQLPVNSALIEIEVGCSLHQSVSLPRFSLCAFRPPSWLGFFLPAPNFRYPASESVPLFYLRRRRCCFCGIQELLHSSTEDLTGLYICCMDARFRPCLLISRHRNSLNSLSRLHFLTT